MVSDGACVELDAEDGLPAIVRSGMSVVALDQNIASQLNTLLHGHGEMAGVLVDVVYRRCVDRYPTLINLHRRVGDEFSKEMFIVTLPK